MCVVPKAANDMMEVGRLQGFDVSTKLRACFSLSCTELDEERMDVCVCLCGHVLSVGVQNGVLICINVCLITHTIQWLTSV